MKIFFPSLVHSQVSQIKIMQLLTFSFFSFRVCLSTCLYDLFRMHCSITLIGNNSIPNVKVGLVFYLLLQCYRIDQKDLQFICSQRLVLQLYLYCLNMINPNSQNNRAQNQDVSNIPKQQKRQQNEEYQISVNIQSAFQNPDFVQLQTAKEEIYQILTENQQICKTIVQVDYSLQEVFEFLKKSDNRLRMFQKCVYITQADEIQKTKHKIQKHIFELQWPHRNRQFIVKMQEKKSDNQVVLAWSSFDQILANQNYVPGYMKISGFIISKIDQNKTKVKYIIQANLGQGGQMLIKNFLHTQCQSIWRLQQYMKAEALNVLRLQKEKQNQMKEQGNNQEEHYSENFPFIQ